MLIKHCVFGNRPRSDDGCLSNVVKLNDISLTKVDSCKYLGLIIDSELTWKMHIMFTQNYLNLLAYFINSATKSALLY